MAIEPISAGGGGLAKVLAVLALFAIANIGTMDRAHAQSAQRGMMFARTNCSTCHAIDRQSPSPLAIAPPFRDLGKRYPVETLEEALAEGIVTGHPTMPEFRLDPGQIGDFIAFLNSLK